MDMDERWLNRDPRTMFETFHGFQGEGFDLIVEDLLALPADAPVLAEGFRLLPRLVAPLLTGRRGAVWLLPTAAMREAANESRGTTWAIAGRTSDPPHALRNLVERDELFVVEIAAQARSLALPTISVDGELTIDELVSRLEDLLGLRPIPADGSEAS